MFPATVFLSLVLVMNQIRPTLSSHTLYVMHLAPTSTTTQWGLIADFAFHLANQRSDILLGYKLQSVTSYGQGENVGQSVKLFIEQISSKPTKVAILGPFYSSQAKVVAETASYYNLLQVAYSVTSPVLSDSSKYPYFARTIESTALHNPAILKILKLYDWKKVATISQVSEFVIGAKDDLQGMMSQSNISTLASTTYISDAMPQLMQIKESKAKIIIGFLRIGSRDGVRDFCKIYKSGLYGPRYQWIMWSRRFGISYNQLRGNWTDGCTNAQVIEAVEGMIYLHPVTMSQEDKTNITSESVGYSSVELKEEYDKYVEQMSQADNMTYPTLFFSNTFDAAWSLLLALNSSMQKLDSLGESLENFTYDKQHVTEVLYNSLLSQAYFGPTGSISFNHNGDRINRILISQIINGAEVTVGSYDYTADLITWQNNKRKIIFQGSHPPYDEDRTRHEVKLLNNLLVSLILVLATVGLIYCIISVAFAVKYRKTKLIKLSSPRINTFIAVGCGIAYLDVILYSLGSTDVIGKDWICTTRIWLLVCAFTLAFGSMFAKTWRVHILFTNKKLQRKVVKDFHLVLFVLVILAFDVILLIIWQGVDPAYWQRIYLSEERAPKDPDYIIKTSVHSCTSKYVNYWLGILYAFKGLLLIFGIFFAWETRKVRIEALNDSKQIGISVYNVMVMSVISVPLVNLLSVEQLNIIYGITTISILVCATTTMTLVYGSKIYLILLHGNKVDDVTVHLPFQSVLKDRQSAVSRTYPAEPSHSQMDTLHIPQKSTSASVIRNPDSSAEK